MPTRGLSRLRLYLKLTLIQNEPISSGPFAGGAKSIPKLTPDWCLALSDLAVECLDSQPGRQSKLLAEAYALLRAVGGSHLTIELPSEDRFSRLLVCEAFESAGIQLVGPNAGYLISRSPDGAHIVSVSMTAAEEVTFECTTPALGLIAGLATALARIDQNQEPGRSDERRVN